MSESPLATGETAERPQRLLLALGANLPARDPQTGAMLEPPLTLARAAAMLAEAGLVVFAASAIYRTSPEGGAPGDPDFANAVVMVETAAPPGECLLIAKALEAAFGRDPDASPMAARPLDIDLLDCEGLVFPDAKGWRRAANGSLRSPGLVLPHPRLHARAFVLMPLADVAPQWRHPVTGEPLASLLARALAQTAIRPVPFRPWQDLLKPLTTR